MKKSIRKSLEEARDSKTNECVILSLGESTEIACYILALDENTKIVTIRPVNEGRAPRKHGKTYPNTSQGLTVSFSDISNVKKT